MLFTDFFLTRTNFKNIWFFYSENSLKKFEFLPKAIQFTLRSNLFFLYCFYLNLKWLSDCKTFFKDEKKSNKFHSFSYERLPIYIHFPFFSLPLFNACYYRCRMAFVSDISHFNPWYWKIIINNNNNNVPRAGKFLHP